MAVNQTRLESFIESVVNTFIGLAIAFTAQYFLFKVYKVQASTEVQCWLVFWMTLISIGRQYLIRRIWNDRGAGLKKCLCNGKKFVTFVVLKRWSSK